MSHGHPRTIAEMEHTPPGERPERKQYELELELLQIELLKAQRHIAAAGERVVVLFEGRDAAGKGGAIKRFTEHLNPRGARTVALAKPTDAERTQWYFQATWPTSRRPVRWCCSTAPGTTAPASNG